MSEVVEKMNFGEPAKISTIDDHVRILGTTNIGYIYLPYAKTGEIDPQSTVFQSFDGNISVRQSNLDFVNSR